MMPSFFQDSKERRKERKHLRKLETAIFKKYFGDDVRLLYDALKQRVLAQESCAHDVTERTARELIAAEYLLNRDVFQRSLRGNYRSYRITIGPCEIEIDPKPIAGHVGNCKIKVLTGLHGHPLTIVLPYAVKNIDVEQREDVTIYSYLQTFSWADDSNNVDKNKERALAFLMMEYIRKGGDFLLDYYSRESYLEDEYEYTYEVPVPGLQNTPTVDLTFSGLQRDIFIGICYLTCVREISRRLASGSHYRYETQYKQYGKELPFGITHMRVLKLVACGKLSLADVFKGNALYGAPVSEGVTSSNLKATKEKIAEVNRKFYESEGQFPASAPSLEEIVDGIKDIYFPGKEIQQLLYDCSSDSECDNWSDDDAKGRPVSNPKFGM